MDNVTWFAEGGFYWLDGDQWADYQNEELKVHHLDEDEDIQDHSGCPNRIILSDVFYLEQVYEDDNVYELYQVGVGSFGECYSLVDFDGTGYYTVLMGSPCQYAYVRASFPYTRDGSLAYIYFRFSTTGTYSFVYSNYYLLHDNVWIEYHPPSSDSGAEFVFYFDFEGSSYSLSIPEGSSQSSYLVLTSGDKSYKVSLGLTKVAFEIKEGSSSVGFKSTALWSADDWSSFSKSRGYSGGIEFTPSILTADDLAGQTADVPMLLEFVGTELGPKLLFTGQGTDTTYDLEEATENYKVLGIIGNTVTIQIDDHKTVTHTYENQVGEVTLGTSGDTIIVTATTKSDPSDVTCQLYQCSADPRVVDKTDYLTNIQQLSGSWVVPFDEMSPVLRINLATNMATSGNYCRIYSTGWGTKYYFIKNRVCVGQEVWDLYLEEDVLMTFKSYFKTATGLIDRSESAYNLLIPDSTIPLEVGQNVTVREITNDVFSDNYGYNYVLTGLLVGGNTE